MTKTQLEIKASQEPRRDRVIYEFGAAPLSQNEKAGLIRLLLEGKFYE